MRSMLLLAACAALAAACQTTAHTNDSQRTGIAAKLRGLEAHSGFLDLFVDRQQGQVWLRLPASQDEVLLECLYVEGLASGLGSNDIGLDRGQLGPTRLVRFRQAGGKLLIEQPNLGFRAHSDDQAERQATVDSFATSVLWGAAIEARDDEHVLVDLTPFIVRDAHDVGVKLRGMGQGNYSLDQGRSALLADSTLAFPDNVELEALLTFEGTNAGRYVRSTVPTASAITLVQHHSFVRLPDDRYEPRVFDPRAGAFSIQFQDYAAALDEALDVQYAVRHRLHKTDPTASVSGVVEPIVYYVERGTPEPVRSALIEGATWWAEAFAAAGFENAFRVELLPADAHPLDVRYNVIQWVHRSTRGWSYGGGVTDPRTGEMIKGHVTLGSLRVRQDRRLFEGLAGTAKTGTGDADDPVELALARIRQLSAHEVGHTLGIAHNFAASTYAGRASVMDYPAPLVGIDENGALDFSNVYDVGIGEWDKHVIRALYGQFAEDEAEHLEQLVRDANTNGWLYLSDQDARPSGASHPLASLWDNGADPVAELLHVMNVRRIALAAFGPECVPEGRPVAELEDVLAPLYFHHRYQLDATVKSIGGFRYRHALRGDGADVAGSVPAATQRAALEAVLEVLSPAALDLPEEVLAWLVPRPPGAGRNRELFNGRSAPVFDPIAAAETMAEHVLASLLNRERCERLVDFQRRDPGQLGLEELLARIGETVFPARLSRNARHAELQRVVQDVCVRAGIRLAEDRHASERVRSRVESVLHELASGLAESEAVDPVQRAHTTVLLRRIERFLARESEPAAAPSTAPEPPPGSPIGAEARFQACSSPPAWL